MPRVMKASRGRRRTLVLVTTTATEERAFPGAERPARQYDLLADGLRLAIHEWGAEDAPSLLLVHGGFDFARTFDLFAPKLADGGWRVVSWDQRGHGDSEHAELYSWDADMRDALAIFDHVSPGQPLPVVGHSKGGALMTQLADAQPFRFTHLVNMDGIPYKRRIPDIAEHERTKMMDDEISGWLDHRRKTSTAQRRPGTIEELATRRGRMNPRLPIGWLERLVTVGGFESDDGWRWKIDPSMRFGGFGPWRPEWTLMRLPGLPMPFLGILGNEMEEMGWGTPPRKVQPYMPPLGRCEVLDDVGHFVHVEQPGLVGEMVLDFLGEPS
jgi:pimeloyl-ACP methyl ester carboxylesterase